MWLRFAWSAFAGLLLSSLVGAAPSAPQPPPPPPHVIFIVADDLGWNDVGWREPHMHTPTLDKLASSGIILNNSYVNYVCSPSRSAFMSGYFPIHTGLQHIVINPAQKVGLPANLTTLPEAMKRQGYATHMVGKWHLGFCNWKYTPTFRGFDSYLGYYNAAEDYYTHVIGSGYDFRKDKDVDAADNGTYSAYVFTDRIIDIISTHNKSQPLFLYLPFQSVHAPLEVPVEYEEKYCSQTKDKDRRTKCGMVAILDEAIANITQTLDDQGYMDNLLLIFTTDNGGPIENSANNLPLRGGKHTLWEGGTRGTAFVYSRNLFPQTGFTYNGMMHAVDWFPTLMDVAYGLKPPGIDGVSMWEAIRTNSNSPRTEFVYNIDDLLKNGAIRMGDYKLIQGDAGPYNGWYPVPGTPEAEMADYRPDNDGNNATEFRLYNIRDDPTEHFDIAPSNPTLVAKMKARLMEWRRKMLPPNYPPPDPASNPKNWDGSWSPGWC